MGPQLEDKYFRITKGTEVTNTSIASMFLSISQALQLDECHGVELEVSPTRVLLFPFEYFGQAQTRGVIMRFGNLEYKCISQPANEDTEMGRRVKCGVPITWFIRKTWEGGTLIRQDWLGHVEDSQFIWNIGVEELLDNERKIAKLARSRVSKDPATEVEMPLESGLDILVDSLHRRITGLSQVLGNSEE